MNRVELKSPVKINLCLDILGFDSQTQKHFVNTILYRDDCLSDSIIMRKRLSGFKNTLQCSDPNIPTDSNNTILRALELLQETGWDIDLEKNIPSQAGLGGASGNAAAILKYFGDQKQLPEHVLLDLAKQIGADVPFFVLDDNLAYFEGYGDQLVQSWVVPPLELEYISSEINVETKTAYQQLDLDKCGLNSRNTELFLKLINESQNEERFQLLTTLREPEDSSEPRTANNQLFHNDFETSFFNINPEWKNKGNLCGSGGYLWKLK